MEPMTSHNSRKPMWLVYAYLALPFLIFTLGWIRWYYAIPIILVSLYALKGLFRNAPSLWVPEKRKSNPWKITLILLIIGGWVALSGVGGFVFQNPDHMWRNAIFELLVRNPWPIIKTDATGSVGFIYYIGFWMPAALGGKMVGLTWGYVAQYLWATLGIELFYYLICAKFRKLLIWPLLLFIFFSGLDIIGILLKGNEVIGWISHIEWWGWPFQFSSMTTQLFWVFNQALPAWLVTMAILMEKNNKGILLLLSFTMLSSSLPFVGLIPIAAYLILKRREGKNPFFSEIGRITKETFSVENIIGVAVIGIVTLLYLKGNNSAQIMTTTNHEFETFGAFVFHLLKFLILEIGLYFLVMLKYRWKDPAFYLLGLLIALIPLIRIGTGGDFAMRASIPALVILFLLVAQTLEEAWKKRDFRILALFSILFVLGAITPVLEINRTLIETYHRIRNDLPITAGSRNLMGPTENNFWGDLEGNVFFTNLAK